MCDFRKRAHCYRSGIFYNFNSEKSQSLAACVCESLFLRLGPKNEYFYRKLANTFVLPPKWAKLFFTKSKEKHCFSFFSCLALKNTFSVRPCAKLKSKISKRYFGIGVV